ncbi:histidine phosphatase superfamily [Xylaria arbuscula]|uniref:Phosphoglycerate mutase-like protein n=1 Tax=Xylaria arbuscula TaxID=114810 RepID=A0A9W8NI72_9PEZI|nr:histidine phosphatase superfamily [Xylaria arbuscula]KAJ3576351.1 hypothetical protein NPX13_g3729 [Xylaria arbuscula]
MPPTIHLIRHAQAEHNVDQDFTIHDPDLTSLGHEQCELAFKEWGNPVIVLASPLQRTIQTALGLFREYTSSGRKIILVPGLQEVGNTPSDTGSPREKLESRFGNDLDYGLLAPDWADKTDKSLISEESIKERARSTRAFIRSIAQEYKDEDVSIVVVTHGKFLWYLTKNHDYWFKNVERRKYVFDDLTGESTEADLTETP